MAEAHFAESFTVMSGRCFRPISRPNAHGQPDQWSEPVVWHGFHTEETGRQWTVDSCRGHAHDLDNRRPSS